MPFPINFQSNVDFHKFVSTCKTQAFPTLCFRDIVDLKTLQSDWPKAFWLISQEPDFPKIWALCKNTADKINFHYRPIS